MKYHFQRIVFGLFAFLLIAMSPLFFPDLNIELNEKNNKIENEDRLNKEKCEKFSDLIKENANDAIVDKDSLYEEYRKTADSCGIDKDSLYVIWSTKRQETLDETKNIFSLKNLGFLAILLIPLFYIFRKSIEGNLKIVVDFLQRKLYTKQAVQNKAINKFTNTLISKAKKVHLPFRLNEYLELNKFHIPSTLKTDDGKLKKEILYFTQNYNKLMITGSPGSGKSILTKQLAIYFAKNYSNLSSVPLLIELSKYNEFDGSFYKLLCHILSIDFPKFYSSDDFLEAYLNNGKLVLLFDGFDEINTLKRDKIVSEIKDLLATYPTCKAIITCRSAVYNNEFNEDVELHVSIEEFSDYQIQSYLKFWRNKFPEGKTIESLFEVLQERPKIHAVARNPLMLTLISHLYSSPDFKIPHSRAEFYNNAVDVLLDKWRNQLNNYKPSYKKHILQDLALKNQTNSRYKSSDRRSLNFTDTLIQTKKTLSELDIPNESSLDILNEIVYRSGLLMEIDGGQRYQFAHLTLQEYFTAKAIHDGELLLKYYREKPNEWREVVKLWCGLDHDSTNLIEAIYKIDETMALECLADAKKIDSEFTERIIKDNIRKIGSSISVEDAFSAIAADPRPKRSKIIFSCCEEFLNTGDKNEKKATARILSKTNVPKAAKILSKYYAEEFLEDSLVKMGDVAVELISSHFDNYPDKVLDDLFKIATPKAAKAILPKLWVDDSSIQFKAAWYIGALISNEEVEIELMTYQLNGTQKHSSTINWIWKPFTSIKKVENSKDRSIVEIIMGRIAYLLLESKPNNESYSNISLDSRLVVPLALVESENTGFTKLDKTNLNSKEVDLSKLELLLEEQNPEIFTLLSSLTDRNQNIILEYLLSDRIAGVSDWLNLYTPSDYKFSKSRHFYAITLFIFFVPIIFLISFIDPLNKITDDFKMFGRIQFFYSLLVSFVFYIFIRKFNFIKSKNKNITFVDCVIIGIVSFQPGIICMPIFLFLSYEFNVSLILLTTIFLVFLIIYFLWLAMKEEQKSQNPLYGIFEKIE